MPLLVVCQCLRLVTPPPPDRDQQCRCFWGVRGVEPCVLVSRLERLGLGILTRSCPAELVDRVVAEAGCARNADVCCRPGSPAYFVLALCLFPQADYLEVLRLVKAGEPTLRPWAGVNKSSLTRARQRLGWPVMRELFRPWPDRWATGRNSSTGYGSWP